MSIQDTNARQTVLVTGATGYIAGWIIQYLLEAGHTVHGTVRDLSRTDNVAHLHRLSASLPGQLKLFKADLLDHGSFDEAMQGCDVVMHTASPFILDGYTDAREALVRPAVEGTRNVLDAVQRCASVRRVVLTSSTAAVFGDNCDIKGKPGGMFTEAHWNETSTVDHNPYQYSKTAAEREAWAMHKAGRGWDLVTINPSMVLGPSMTCSSRSGSIDTLLQLVDGRLRSGVPDLGFGVVDVRDVAQAHLRAAFKASATGRHILSAETLTMMEIARILKGQFGSRYAYPLMTLPKAMTWLVGPMVGPITRKFVSRNVGHHVKFDNRKSREELGVTYRPVQQTLCEHFQQMLDDGLLKTKAA